MALHVDTSTIATDALYFTLVFIFSNAIRIFFRPFALEASLIAKFLAKFVISVIDWMKKWTAKEHHPNLDKIKSDLFVLRNKLKTSKIKIG